MTTGREVQITLPGPAEGQARGDVGEHLQAKAAGLDAVNTTLHGLRAGKSDTGDQRGRLESAFENAAIGMGLLDLEGRWLKVNRALGDITGLELETLLVTPLDAITHEDDLDIDRAQRRQLMARAIPSYQIEKRFNVGKREVWVLVTVSLVHDAEGDPAARDRPGPGHLRAEGAQARLELPDGPRFPDRPVQPAPLRAGAHAARSSARRATEPAAPCS